MGKKIRIISVCIIFVSLFSVLVLKPRLLSEFCPETQKSETIQPQAQESKNSFGTVPRLSISPGRRFKYLINPIGNTEDKCKIYLFDQDNTLDSNSLLGFDTINCSSEMGFTSSDVRGWVGNDTLSIERLNPDYKTIDITSIDLRNSKTYTYQPKRKDLSLQAHSINLSSFIFSGNGSNDYFYSNGDESSLQKIDMSKVITNEYNLKEIVFDPFNDTYLITTSRQTPINDRLYPGNINYQISTINEKHLEPKIIYTSPNFKIYHPMQILGDIYPSGKNKITLSHFLTPTTANPNGDKEISVLIN